MEQNTLDTSISVNGREHPVQVPPKMRLLEFLRESLGLTGTKCGCGYGVCGSCTILIEGKPARACLVPMSYASGKQIQTIEGLAAEGQLHSVQRAFLQHGAYQCGFCTPGMILEVCGFLNQLAGRIPEPTEVHEALHSHICRCGSYQRIVAAVIDAAQQAGRAQS